MSDSLGRSATPVPAADGDPAAESLPDGDFPTSPLLEKMGIRMLEVGPERAVATMPVEGNTQPFGLLHGGASCVLAETVGSLAAYAHAQQQGKVAVGLEISAAHHRALRAGTVTATAQALHRGRSTATYEITIADEQQRRVCSARLTCMLLPDPEQAPTAPR